MSRRKSTGPAWFKTFGWWRDMIDGVPDDVAGRALKAALNYFASSQAPTDLDPMAALVFSSLKTSVDAAWADWRKAVEDGSKGGAPTHKPKV